MQASGRYPVISPRRTPLSEDSRDPASAMAVPRVGPENLKDTWPYLAVHHHRAMAARDQSDGNMTTKAITFRRFHAPIEMPRSAAGPPVNRQPALRDWLSGVTPFLCATSCKRNMWRRCRTAGLLAPGNGVREQSGCGPKGEPRCGCRIWRGDTSVPTRRECRQSS